MGYFEKHPTLFRTLLLVLALYLTGIGVVNLYYFTSSSTDENLFTTPPSNLYIVRGFPAERTVSSGLQLTPQQLPDSVSAGNLLTSINGQKVESTADVTARLKADTNDYLTLGVFLLKENAGRTYKVRRSSLPGYFVRDIPPTAYVIDVVPGGASDQAGIRVGDLIVSINGQRFETIFEADKIMRQGRAGVLINYEILRNNTTLNLNLTLSRVRVPLPLFMIFLSGLLFMGTGLFIGLRRPQFVAARLLGLAFLCIGFIWVSAYGGTSVPMPLLILRFTAFISTSLFGIALWLHGSLYFPVEQPHLLQKKWLYRIPYYFAGACTIVLIGLGLQGKYNDVLLLAGITLLILYTISVVLSHRKQFTPEYKRMSKPLRLTAMLAPLVIIVLLFTLELLPEARNAWTNVLAPSIMAAVPLSYLYVIGRYRLLDLHLRVRRTIQYTFLSTVWKTSLLIIALSTLYFLTQLDLDVPNLRFTGVALEIPKEPITDAERAVLEKITLMIAAICFTFAFWEIGRAGQNYINRVYYRSEYDYRQASASFADIFATTFNLEELAAGIVRQTAASVHLKQAGILIFRNGTIACRQETRADGEQQTEKTTGVDGAALYQALGQFHGGFSVNYLPRALRDAVHDNGYYHLVPVRSKENTIGVVAIGEKLSEADIERDDLAFLESVSRQAAVAIENAFLYEELAGQERLKHELAIAREIQLASLPQTTPDITGLDIAGLSCPALEVGGDYFDYLNGSPGFLTVLVGDVSGKGTSAALYMSKVQGILRSLHAFDLSPKELFIRTNQLLYNDLEKKSYVTALSARFVPEQHSINIARAGHLPLLHYDAATGSVRHILPRGLGLGMVNSTVFATRIDDETLHYQPGDIFLFVTDGITEAMNENRAEFGDDRLHELLCKTAGSDANTIRDTIHDAVREFTGTAALHDDFTVVVVKAV